MTKKKNKNLPPVPPQGKDNFLANKTDLLDSAFLDSAWFNHDYSGIETRAFLMDEVFPRDFKGFDFGSPKALSLDDASTCTIGVDKGRHDTTAWHHQVLKIDTTKKPAHSFTGLRSDWFTIDDPLKDQKDLIKKSLSKLKAKNFDDVIFPLTEDDVIFPLTESDGFAIGKWSFGKHEMVKAKDVEYCEISYQGFKIKMDVALLDRVVEILGKEALTNQTLTGITTNKLKALLYGLKILKNKMDNYILFWHNF